MDSSVSQILILLVLLLLSGIFSSAETALTTYNKIRMRALADEGNKRASAKALALSFFSQYPSVNFILTAFLNKQLLLRKIPVFFHQYNHLLKC